MAPVIKIGIIGGSGLDDPDILANRSTKSVNTPFGKPSDDLIVGTIEGVPCVILARHGRKHDIMPGNVNYPANIWALKQEGCTHIIASTATGSLHENYHPGDVVILDNFIDKTQGRAQTFHDGKQGHPPGVLHLPMEPAFCLKTRQILIDTAKELGIPVHNTGTVISIEGPRFSSKAETMMHRQWGAHVINMTSATEIVLAKEAAICYGSIAIVTDYDCWKEGAGVVSAGSVVEMFKKNVGKLTRLISAAVSKIAKDNWEKTIKDLDEVVKHSTNVA